MRADRNWAMPFPRTGEVPQLNRYLLSLKPEIYPGNFRIPAYASAGMLQSYRAILTEGVSDIEHTCRIARAYKVAVPIGDIESAPW
jgi:hypothetical protein